MKKLNTKKLKKELEKYFSFFESYQEFLFLTSEDKSTKDLSYEFNIVYKSNIIPLEEKSYLYEERKKIVVKELEQKKSLSEKLIFCEKILIMVENPKFKFLPKKYKYHYEVKKLIPDLVKLKKYSALIIQKKEFNDCFFSELFLIPFLFSYLDIYILPYNQDYFYFINHHTDIFEVFFNNK